MADLIAQGPQNYHRWRREIPDAATCNDLVIGRSDADWNVPWDPMISRAHVRLIPQADERIEIMAVPSARNPVYHQGRHAVRFVLVPGDHFVIGKTTFTLAAATSSRSPERLRDPAGDDGMDVTENVFDHVALRRKHFRDVNARIDVLTRLPDLIASSDSDQELLVRVTSVLLQSTPSAEAVSILSAAELKTDPDASIEVLHYDNRSATLGGSPISRRLVKRSIEKRESILNVWAGGDSQYTTSAFTAREDVDWAYCVPLRTEACRGWVIYITGKLPDAGVTGSGKPVDVSEQLHDDVKFAELVGTTMASLQQSRQLQRRQAAMRNFFAPVVMRALASGDTARVLKPREADLTVMFCDLRGFSRRSEQDSQNLLQLLSDVSDALGVMTKHILGYDGVIGDFHGDAAMGFWGWPLAQEQSVLQAASAALAIQAEYHHSDLGFRCGIGLAHGRAVAGQIGTKDQVKVTAFGPVVNLSSRLESMSKRFGAEIILDEATRAGLLASGQHQFKLRRLAKVRPAGFASPVEISELIGEAAIATHQVTDALIADYEAALDLFCASDLDAALKQFRSLPTWDGPTQMMVKQILSGDSDGEVIELPK
ncbi:adenylate/guanylate cyclase domain-containing protein [Stieleria sp. ICT_E10.1]|uniref:adenylate/guanylate cyclase domain-containing protein n=1 Tax=Stieleria sedimenti TaxID=2976331 RepID=UPI0021805FC8|nr:adenylate/guanylate cyclase domain-containing protein [Stieleria sedimenti]MCS7466245.1 adenylate/guanylate cyclase domain-containing protein [Stieleria sedimenti]